MAVIDLTNDPRIDMAMAQSIGNILKSVGQAEQNRQKRYRIDQIMTDVNNNVDPMVAIQKANRVEAPRGEGLAGVWQSAGRLLGGAPRDVDITDKMVEESLLSNFKLSMLQKNPMYQAELAGTKARTAGTEQNTKIARDMAPIRKEAAEQNIQQKADIFPSQKEAAELGVEQKKRDIAQQKLMDPLQFQKVIQDIENDKLKMGWAAEDAKRAAENQGMREVLFNQQQEGKVSDDLYKAKLRVLDLEGKELDNKYAEARIAAVGKTDGDIRKLQRDLDKDTKNMTPEMFKAYKKEASKQGYTITKKDVAEYPAGVKTDKEGRKYSEQLGYKKYIEPEYRYIASEKSSQSVILQDDQGVTVATLPPVPEGKTYVENNGEYFSIPTDQIDEFKKQYPKGSVYQTGKP